jgi:hypothetical protein
MKAEREVEVRAQVAPEVQVAPARVQPDTCRPPAKEFRQEVRQSVSDFAVVASGNPDRSWLDLRAQPVAQRLGRRLAVAVPGFCRPC